MFKRDDWIFGVISLSLGIFVLLNVEELRSVESMDPAGPVALPAILAWLMIAIGVVHIAASLLLLRKKPSAGGTKPAKKAESYRPVALITLTCALYVLVLPVIGYPLATPLLIAAVMFVLGVRSPKKLICTSVLDTAVLFAAFFYGLRVSLPLGILETFF